MGCPYYNLCGGCCFRELDEQSYHDYKIENLEKILIRLNDQNYKMNTPIFITDGKRRRAAFNFRFTKKELLLGFNEKSSHNIVDVEYCSLLSPQLNKCIPSIKKMLSELCDLKYTVKKQRKFITSNISQGDVLICEADNGIDLVLEYDAPTDINARMIMAEFCQSNEQIIRISHRCNSLDPAEVILQKITPIVRMGNFDVKIPAGTFLQASKESEIALAHLATEYLKDVKGKIADLFCGVGTFSYYIASKLKNFHILAIDSGDDLLQGFQASINSNQLKNIEIKKQNLFKYPLTSEEISDFEAILFDPPRAGAKELCRQIALASKKPSVIVAVSCNPLSFVHDANILTDAGYNLKEITMVDQFVYSNHCELVALFSL